MEGPARATLVPIHHQEMTLQLRIVMTIKGRFADAWAAMQKNYCRVGCVQTAKPNPLRDSSDVQVLHGSDATRDELSFRIAEWRGMDASRRQEEHQTPTA